MQFDSALSTKPFLNEAFEEVLAILEAADRVSLAEADVLFLFASHHTVEAFEAIVAQLRRHLPRAHMLGTLAESTIGSQREVEGLPALSLMVGTLPEVSIEPVRVRAEEVLAAAGVESDDDADAGDNDDDDDPDGDDENESPSFEEAHFAPDASDWMETLGVDPADEPVLLVVADPFTFPVNEFLSLTQWHMPNVPILGGMASAGSERGQNRLLLDGEVYEDGLVGLAMHGNVRVDTVVSQGCRPVGRRFVATKAQDQILLELAGRPALQALQEMVTEASEDEQDLMQQGVFIGKVIDEQKPDFKRGDFLILNVVGVEPTSGALAVAGKLRTGQTVQFHVRDADAADEDLREMFEPYVNGATPAGALIVSCNGRGTRLFPQADHDIGVLRELCGPVPATGFFAAGEIGPVGGRNFLHGYTAAVALFSPKWKE